MKEQIMKALSNIFTPPSAESLAQLELEEAKRELLVAQSATEYSNRMAAYPQDRLKRLTSYLKDSTVQVTNEAR